MDHDSIGKDDFLGKTAVNVEFSELPQKFDLPLEAAKGTSTKGKISGSIQVAVTI